MDLEAVLEACKAANAFHGSGFALLAVQKAINTEKGGNVQKALMSYNHAVENLGIAIAFQRPGMQMLVSLKQKCEEKVDCFEKLLQGGTEASKFPAKEKNAAEEQREKGNCSRTPPSFQGSILQQPASPQHSSAIVQHFSTMKNKMQTARANTLRDTAKKARAVASPPATAPVLTHYDGQTVTPAECVLLYGDLVRFCLTQPLSLRGITEDLEVFRQALSVNFPTHEALLWSHGRALRTIPEPQELELRMGFLEQMAQCDDSLFPSPAAYTTWRSEEKQAIDDLVKALQSASLKPPTATTPPPFECHLPPENIQKYFSYAFEGIVAVLSKRAAKLTLPDDGLFARVLDPYALALGLTPLHTTLLRLALLVANMDTDPERFRTLNTLLQRVAGAKGSGALTPADEHALESALLLLVSQLSSYMQNPKQFFSWNEGSHCLKAVLSVIHTLEACFPWAKMSMEAIYTLLNSGTEHTYHKQHYLAQCMQAEEVGVRSPDSVEVLELLAEYLVEELHMTCDMYQSNFIRHLGLDVAALQHCVWLNLLLADAMEVLSKTFTRTDGFIVRQLTLAQRIHDYMAEAATCIVLQDLPFTPALPAPQLALPDVFAPVMDAWFLNTRDLLLKWAATAIQNERWSPSGYEYVCECCVDVFYALSQPSEFLKTIPYLDKAGLLQEKLVSTCYLVLTEYFVAQCALQLLHTHVGPVTKLPLMTKFSNLLHLEVRRHADTNSLTLMETSGSGGYIDPKTTMNSDVVDIFQPTVPSSSFCVLASVQAARKNLDIHISDLGSDSSDFAAVFKELKQLSNWGTDFVVASARALLTSTLMDCFGLHHGKEKKSKKAVPQPLAVDAIYSRVAAVLDSLLSTAHSSLPEDLFKTFLRTMWVATVSTLQFTALLDTHAHTTLPTAESRREVYEQLLELLIDYFHAGGSGVGPSRLRSLAQPLTVLLCVLQMATPAITDFLRLSQNTQQGFSLGHPAVLTILSSRAAAGDKVASHAVKAHRSSKP